MCRNHRARFLARANGPQPVSDFQTRFRSSTDDSDDMVENQHGSDLVLADCVGFWPNGSGPETSWCGRIIRPASGQLIRTGCQSDGSGRFSGCRVDFDPAGLVGVELISLGVWYPYVAPRFSFQRNKEVLDRLCSCSFVSKSSTFPTLRHADRL